MLNEKKGQKVFFFYYLSSTVSITSWQEQKISIQPLSSAFDRSASATAITDTWVSGLTVLWQVGNVSLLNVAQWQHSWQTISIPSASLTPSQINMTQDKHVWHVPIQSHLSYIVLTRPPFQRRPTCTLNGSHSSTWTICAPPLPIASVEEKALIFCSAEGREKWASHFPISTCQVVPQPQSVGQSICQSQHIVSWGKMSLCVSVWVCGPDSSLAWVLLLW